MLATVCKAVCALAGSVALAACATSAQGGANGAASEAHADIAGVLSLKSVFGPKYQVSTVKPTGVDPRLLAPQSLPAGAVFDPAACAKDAAGLTVPAGLRGNMAATTAEGEGVRYIALAVQTSDAVSMASPGPDCRRIAFAAGAGVRGLVEVVDSPAIDGARTLGKHEVLQTTVDGKPASGELYDYVATFDTFLVIVTANPVVLPNVPVAKVDIGRAHDLLVKAVAAVRGS